MSGPVGQQRLDAKAKITVPTVGSNPGFTAVQTYTYDSLNRIQSATETINSSETWKQTFSIDRYGNRRFNTANNNTTTIPIGCAAAVCNPDINTSDNRLSEIQGYDYDANGALEEDASGQRFKYDAESHQKEFFSASNQTTTPDATYHYDGEGKRVKNTVGTEVTVFVYDASGQLAAEYSTTIEPPATAKLSYLTADHLGSPRIITDQNGAVISRKDFTAFGEEVLSLQRVPGQNGNGYNMPNVRQDYTGYQKDGESGLEFAQARYYNADHGRFTSVDPLTASAAIRNPQTFNRYSYVINSPYKFVDPLGLTLMDAGIMLTTDATLPGIMDRIWAHNFRNATQSPPQPTAQQTREPLVGSDIPEDAMCNPDHPYWQSWYTQPTQTVSATGSFSSRIVNFEEPIGQPDDDGGQAYETGLRAVFTFTFAEATPEGRAIPGYEYSVLYDGEGASVTSGVAETGTIQIGPDITIESSIFWVERGDEVPQYFPEDNPIVFPIRTTATGQVAVDVNGTRANYYFEISTGRNDANQPDARISPIRSSPPGPVTVRKP